MDTKKTDQSSLSFASVKNTISALPDLSLRDYIKVKRKRVWSKRFVVLDGDCLYYFKSPASPTPRFYMKLAGIEVKALGYSKGQYVLQISDSKTNLKLGFDSESTLQVWFDSLNTPLQEPKGEVYKESHILDKINFGRVDPEILHSLEQKPYKLCGTQGDSLFYSDKPDESHRKYYYVLIAYLIISILNHQLSGVLLIGYLAFFYKDHKSKVYSFKCRNTIFKQPEEVLAIMNDPTLRFEWDPYLDLSSDSTVKYRGKSQTLNQTIAKIDEFYVVQESTDKSIKNFFKIEGRNQQTFVTHYGYYTDSLDPLTGSPSLLTCLKQYTESTQRDYCIDSKDDSIDEEIKNDYEQLNITNSENLSLVLDWNTQAVTIMKEVLKINKEPGWENYKIKDPLTQASKRKAPGGLVIIRGMGEVKKPVLEVIKFLKVLDNKPGYDEMFQSGYIVDEINEDMEIVYQKYKKQAGITPRDFCLLQRRFYLPDQTVVGVAMSIEHPQCPDTDCVRAHLFLGCFILEPTSDSSTRVTYIVHADIKGNIPKFLVNGVQEKQAYVVTKIRNLLDN